jgi:hypothetical protein
MQPACTPRTCQGGLRRRVGSIATLRAVQDNPDRSNLPFLCRSECGACCIAPSITTPFFGMPNGKRAGERCVHLDEANACRLFGRPERPRFCIDLRAEPSMCGADAAEAMAILDDLERRTGQTRVEPRP